MGYTAYTVDSDFTIPADKIEAASVAVHKVLLGLEQTDEISADEPPLSLMAAFDDNTGFANSEILENGDWEMGYHTDKYHDEPTEGMIAALGPFATEGSHVRFQGEDECLWGFIVVNGRIEFETGDYAWKIVPREDGTTPDPASALVNKLTQEQFDLVIKLAGILEEAGYAAAAEALDEVVGNENPNG